MACRALSPGRCDPSPWGQVDCATCAQPSRGLLLLVLLLALRSDLSKSRKILGFDFRSRSILTADGVVDFLAMDADLLGGVDPQTHLVTADVYHGDLDVVADHDRLVALTGQHQHTGLLPG